MTTTMLQYPESIHETAAPSHQTRDILTEAKKTIGQRTDQYGTPATNFERAAAIATVILGDKLRLDHTVTATDWVLLMALAHKGSRLIENPCHDDSQVDLCGYTALLGDL